MTTYQLKNIGSADFDMSLFYEQNYKHGVNIAMKYGLDYENGRDIVSDVFLKLLETNVAIDSNRNPVSLFRTMVINKCLDFIRHKKLINKHHKESVINASSKSESSDANCLYKELESIVSSSLDKLTPRQREIFLSVRVENLSYKETAKRMNIRLRQVEFPLNKATEIVRSNVRALVG